MANRKINLPRACIFDLFHTLVSFEVAKTPGPDVPEILGVEPERWWQIWTTDNEDYLLGRRTLAEVLPEKARLANPQVTEEQIRHAITVRPQRFRHLLTHVEQDTIAALEQLNQLKMPMALLSNCGKDEVAAWDESPLAPFFDITIFSYAVGLHKPDPAIYRLAANWLGVKPEDCLYVGNGGSDEFRGALDCGMFCVLITRHMELVAPHQIPAARALADLTVNTVHEIVQILREVSRR